MNLPNRLFFTGCPGSRWSGIAQDLEQLPGVNTSDHSPLREYNHGQFSGHRGAYFGHGMEFSADLSYIPDNKLENRLNQPWQTTDGMKIIKSHDWSLQLQFIKDRFPDDWIMLVYRPTMSSYTWWIQAGGFNITYPSYTEYKTHEDIYLSIEQQNKCILSFGAKNNVTWSHYSNRWIKETFGHDIPPVKQFDDILVRLSFSTSLTHFT